nr:MAG TPA: hypothetical protein [Caudoviricetes sp.]
MKATIDKIRADTDNANVKFENHFIFFHLFLPY